MLAGLDKMEMFSQPLAAVLKLPLERRAALYLRLGWILTLKKQMVLQLLSWFSSLGFQSQRR